MHLFDLPTELLSNILSLCEDLVIAETCQTFAAILHSIKSLWTCIFLGPRQFTPDGPDFLRTRLKRAHGALLYVSIELLDENPWSGAYALCDTLAEHNTQINHLELSMYSALVAGSLVQRIFPSAISYPGMEIFSVTVEREVEPRRPEKQQLDSVLQDATAMFPSLQELLLPSFYESLPLLPVGSSFSHLHTLVLDGSREEIWTPVALIVTLLHCTPQLETLWVKHHWWEQYFDVFGSEYPLPLKGRSKISLHVHLPRLTHLAVSVTGSACDLLYCLDTPVLEYLHLDGSRGPQWEDGDVDSAEYEWSEWATGSVQGALKRLATRCNNLRAFAITRVYLSRVGWDWLLFGNDSGGKPSFPRLESIALHAQSERVDGITSGFDDGLLARYARLPMLPLRRLAMLRCDFELSAESVVDVFRNTLADGGYELECDEAVPQFSGDGDEEAALESLGVSRVWWWADEIEADQWWTYGHGIDEWDSSMY